MSIKCPQGVCSRLEEGVSNEEQFGWLLQLCHLKLTSLQEKMSACQTQRETLVGLFTEQIHFSDTLYFSDLAR